MATPTYRIVCHELHAARQHLYDLVRPLSQDELLWLPPQADGASISYDFGHIAFFEEIEIARTAGKPLLAAAELQEAFGMRNATNRAARFPSGATIIDYMQQVRARTLVELALRFRAIRDPEAAIAAAEPFRRIINHEYAHTKHIRRACAELGKPPVDPPDSERVHVDESAVAAPQYSIPCW